MRALVAWRGGLFMTEVEIGVLCVRPLFLTRVGVYVGVGVYIYTHTHTLHIWGTRLSPKNPDGLNLGIHIFVYVFKVHMCMYIIGGEMRSWTNCLFL